MSLSRLEEIRLKEKLYHDEFYQNVKLFTNGTWLQMPVRTVMDTFESLPKKTDVKVLDLGCGVGRNSIPVAQQLEGANSKVVCVDLLESAITKLEEYAHEFGVADKLELVQLDISDFNISSHYFDYIISVSALEHLDSILTFQRVLNTLKLGTNEQGVHCFIISSNIQETEIDTGLRLDPMFELQFKTDTLMNILRNTYTDWAVSRETVAEYSLEIVRDDKRVLLKSDVVTWIAQKR
jgi:tellurite methyltransferase